MNDLFEAGMIVVNPDKSITVSKDGQLIGNASDQEMWCCSALEAHRMYELLCISNLVVYFFAKKDVFSLYIPLFCILIKVLNQYGGHLISIELKLIRPFNVYKSKFDNVIGILLNYKTKTWYTLW